MNNIEPPIFTKKNDLPNRQFAEKINYFLAFEPSFLYDDFFYTCLSQFSNKVDGDSLISIEVLDSNGLHCPENICEIANKIQLRDNWDKIFHSGCNCIYSQIIGVYSKSSSWGIYIDNVDFEIGLVGFENEELMNLFLDVFSEDLNMFQSVEDYVNEMDSILDFSPETRKKFDAIVQNHSTH